ncbi:hypothetical protein [Chamaesiphon sp. VAR_69_metabat_338]|uniref:hypothetical protein n=1 Tax=Chamaesiphon sp. VAR_69_metabat_338 TaxID=2964704 RepID=UPI00286DA826|nr:hypothetical protein [Chamaesiphon sp. VAR_69_metabat_338]
MPEVLSNQVHFTHITIVSSGELPKVPFPWSAFLSQPIFHPKHKLILNPTVFRQIYQVRLLESCLRKQLPSTGSRNLSS